MEEITTPHEVVQNTAQRETRAEAPENTASTKLGSGLTPNTQEQREGQQTAHQQLAEEHETRDQHALTKVREQSAELLGVPAADSRQTWSETHPNLADLKEKVFASEKEYTPQEAFYLEHGWKAYLKEYGSEGYTLEEIVRTERLDASEIHNLIAEGIVTDPNALRLYGKIKLEQTRTYFTKWAEDHAADRPDAKEIAATAIAQAEEECNPLIHGDEKDLSRYSTKQAQHALERSTHQQLDLTDEEREGYETQAQNWIAFSEHALTQLPEERQLDLSENTEEPEDIHKETPEGAQEQANTPQIEETAPAQNEQTKKQITFIETWIKDLQKRQKQTEGEQGTNIKKQITALQQELELVQAQAESEILGEEIRERNERKKILQDKTKSPLARFTQWYIAETVSMVKDDIKFFKEGINVWREQVKANNASGLSRSAAFRKNFADYWKIAWRENPIQHRVRMHKLQANRSAPPNKAR